VAVCREITAALDNARVEPEVVGEVTISRLDRERVYRTYDLATRTEASRERLMRLVKGECGTRSTAAEGWIWDQSESGECREKRRH